MDEPTTANAPQTGSRGASGTAGAGGAPASSGEELPEAVSSLCERRLKTNDFLCSVLGTVAGTVAGGPVLAQVGIGTVVTEGCVRVADWLEHNAGACEKE